LESTEHHSYAKLALGVVTSPAAAFEEILSRKLIGGAIIIPAIAGTLAMVASLLRNYGQGPIHLFSLGYFNPVTWVGLALLYAVAVHFVMKWLGTDSDFRSIVTVMGWAQVLLVLAYLMGTVEGALTIAFGSASQKTQSFAAAMSVLDLWYLPVVGIGIRVATNTNISRAILSYLMIHLALWMGLSQTYSSSRFQPFVGSTLGISHVARLIINEDRLPWLAAGFLGLVLGLWHLGKALDWPEGLRKRRATTAALIGVAVVAGYYYALWKTDYYGQILAAGRQVQSEHYDRAAARLEGLLPVVPAERGTIALEIGDASYAGGDYSQAEKYYRMALKSPKSTAAIGLPPQDARAWLGLGMVEDIRGNYKDAVADFKKSARLWKQFREPWTRLAITYARMRDYDKTIEAGDHAIKELKSEAPEVYVALLEAHTAKGDLGRAKSDYGSLKKLNEDLAKRIGDKPEGWKNAVGKLTRSDLKFPLEEQMAKPPERPKRGAPPAGAKKRG
jgi:hypothetical protein